MSAASYFAAYASTSAFLLFTDRLSGKQSRLTATIPISFWNIVHSVNLLLSYAPSDRLIVLMC